MMLMINTIGAVVVDHHLPLRDAAPKRRAAAPAAPAGVPKNVIYSAALQSNMTGWWFGTFFVFPYIGNNNPN